MPIVNRPEGPVFVVSTREEWKVLGSATWSEVADLLSAFKNGATAVELAESWNRPVVSVYHHLRKLERHGLVSMSYHTTKAGRTEALFTVTTRKVELDVDFNAKKNDKAFKDSFALQFRHAARNLTRAVEQGLISASGKDREWRVQQFTGRLDDDEVNKVEKLLDEVMAICEESKKAGEAKPGNRWSVSLAFVPAAAPRGHRNRLG